MKTAEDWVKEYYQDIRNNRMSNEPRKLKHSSGDYIRAIQSDAIENTVRKCVKLCAMKDGSTTNLLSKDYLDGRNDAAKAILSLIPQKEKKV